MNSIMIRMNNRMELERFIKAQHNTYEKASRMKANSLANLSPEQCWRIYSRLEEMTLKLAEYAGIEREALERYFVPLCQEDENPDDLLGVNESPRRITHLETVMWQFARSLQNSGRMSRAVGLDGRRDGDHERAFKKLHDLTDGLHTALLKTRVFESLNAVVKDADVDSIDDELSRAEAARSAQKAGERTASKAVRGVQIKNPSARA